MILFVINVLILSPLYNYYFHFHGTSYTSFLAYATQKNNHHNNNHHNNNHHNNNHHNNNHDSRHASIHTPDNINNNLGNVNTKAASTLIKGQGLIIGTNQDDYITGSELDDTVFAKDGNDIVLVLGGDDTVYAGKGDDTIYGGDGNNQVFGEDGNDNIFGGPFNDLLKEVMEMTI